MKKNNLIKTLIFCFLFGLLNNLNAQTALNINSQSSLIPGTITVQITVSSPSVPILGWDINLNYNKDILTYVSINRLYPTTDANNWNISDAVNPLGLLLGYDHNGVVQTFLYPNNTVVCELTFTYNGGNTDLDAVEGELGFYNTSWNRIPATFIDGAANGAKVPITSVASGGLWDSPATWVPANVPNASANTNVYIGSTTSPVVVDANLNITNNVTINSGAALTVNSGKTLNVGSLTIKDGGSYINNGTGPATATIERNITGPWLWHFFSSPVSGQKIVGASNFIEFTGAPAIGDNNVDFYRLEAGAANQWVNIKQSNGQLNTFFDAVNPSDPEFKTGTGYLVSYNSVSTTKSFTGALNSTSIAPLLLANQLNFIGNPYPSAIDWDNTAIYKGNLLSNYCWIYNELKSGGAGFETFNTGKIAAMQGFYVDCGAINSLMIPLSARVHNGQSFLKNTAALVDGLTLKFSNGTKWDDTKIEFGQNGTSGKDRYDAAKLFSFDISVPQVYSTISTGQKFAVNSLPGILNNTIVPIGIFVPANGNYTIEASGLNSFAATTYVYLKDLTTNAITDLNQNAMYSFAATTTDNADRFQLIFALSPLAISNNEAENTSIYSYDNTIYINSSENIQQIAVYNTLGQLIKTFENTKGKVTIDMSRYTTGYYFVKLVTSKNVYSQKVIVK